MKFFEDFVGQKRKQGQVVCGDAFVCDRSIDGTIFILCDGIGSGAYANIAAISCSSRLHELLKNGVSLRAAAEMTAASMHKAREAEIPFSAFSMALILPDGRFSVYTYESPEAVAVLNGFATVLKPEFYTAGYEVVGEVSGMLEIGDSLLLCSDGVTQAGMGHGLGMGIGSQGLANFVNKQPVNAAAIRDLPESVLAMTAAVSGDRYEDDATFALLHCREASQLTVLTGPPSQSSKDAACVADFMAMPGAKVVCGSTTAEIVARELKREVKMLKVGTSFGSPPEYHMQGIDLTTEGAIMLNQVYNILGESTDSFEGGVVERLAAMLTEADVVHVFMGGGTNTAHSGLLFKQIGVMPRKKTVRLLAEKLKEMGKLVTEKQY